MSSTINLMTQVVSNDDEFSSVSAIVFSLGHKKTYESVAPQNRYRYAETRTHTSQKIPSCLVHTIHQQEGISYTLFYSRRTKSTFSVFLLLLLKDSTKTIVISTLDFYSTKAKIKINAPCRKND